MGEKEMFSDAKIGDKVWDFQNGWGVIVDLDSGDYPIIVEFHAGAVVSYTTRGHFHSDGANPSLFWDVVRFEVPPKPPARLDVDDKVVVWSDECGKTNRHFSHFSKDGVLHTFYGGRTSFTSEGHYSAWENWELVE